MNIFDTDKKIIAVYLSRSGCIDYTKEMIKGFQTEDPLLVLSPFNKEQFSAYQTVLFKTYSQVFHLLLHTLFIQARVIKLMDNLRKQHGSIQLYIPAFHPWNVYFAKWAKDNSIHCTITIHDYKTHKGEKSLITEQLQKKTISLASQVVFLTDYVRQQCITELGPSEKYKVLSHPLLSAGCTNTLPHSSRPRLLFLGRVVGYKGLDLLLEAIKDLEIEKLTIAGKQNKLIIEESDKTVIIDKVLSEAEISELLVTHEILVLPYTEASQSGVLTLGISAEMVMLITKVGGLEEQLDVDTACWVEASVAGVREGLERLIDDPAYFGKIKEKVKATKEFIL